MAPVQAIGPTVQPPGMLARLRELRDRWLASPAFQRRAAAFPLTRPIARRRAKALFDLCAGFVYSQTLLAFVRLRLPEILLEAPRSIEELAPRLALGIDATRRLLDAAAALELAERRDGETYGLGSLGAALAGNPGLRAMIEHHALLYRDLADPVALLRSPPGAGELATFWPYAAGSAGAGLSEERVAAYSQLMSATQPFVADQVLDACPLEGRRCLLDVGGGEGAFLVSAARRTPALQLLLFDLPGVAQRARQRFEAEGLAERARAVGGDFRVDALPPGADTVSFVRVLHDHDDETVKRLLAQAYRALPPDGLLLVAEPMAGMPGAETVGDVYFAFYLHAMGRGRARRADELAEMMRAAGFERVQAPTTHLPLQAALLTARVPRSKV